MSDKPRKLYLIGGSARSGKTTLLKTLVQRQPMLALSTDAFREGARNIFVGESYLDIQKLEFSGEVRFRRAGEKEVQDKHFSYELTEDGLTWRGVRGVMNHYDRKNLSFAIEGLHITPERVKKLWLEWLETRPVFLGFTQESHFANIISHAKEHNDWINKVLDENDGDEAVIWEWFNKTLEKNKQLAKDAEQHGYRFFDISTKPFAEVIEEAADHLLANATELH